MLEHMNDGEDRVHDAFKERNGKERKYRSREVRKHGSNKKS